MVSTRYRVVYFKREDDDMSKLGRCGKRTHRYYYVRSVHDFTTHAGPYGHHRKFFFLGPMTMNEKQNMKLETCRAASFAA